jgi:hypothetical protein
MEGENGRNIPPRCVRTLMAQACFDEDQILITLVMHAYVFGR